MKPSFLNQPRPLLTAMIQEKTPDDIICCIMDAAYDGAEAFGIQLENLEKQYRTKEHLTRIFSHCLNKPTYITSYRNAESEGMTDDECARLLLLGIECGATLGDVMGDYFHPEPHELTFDKEAVQKQKELIDKIHALGGEVLISSHLHEFFDEAEIIRYAKEQERRGADVIKIVSFAQTREQLMADINIAEKLKYEVTKPYLYLANGPHSHLLRQIGPAFGVCMYLCMQNHKPHNSKEQPKLTAAKAIRDAMFL